MPPCYTSVSEFDKSKAEKTNKKPKYTSECFLFLMHECTIIQF